MYIYSIVFFFLIAFQPKIESFDSFYQRFLVDEKFQISRIKFPLKGYQMDGESAGSSSNTSTEYNYTWTIKTWTTLKKMDKSDLPYYTIQKIKQKNKVIIRIVSKESGELYEEHFSLISNLWFLTYYKDISM